MSIEENASEIIEENASKKIYFKAYLDNPTQETKLLNTPLGKIINRNLKMSMEALALLPTEIGGYVKFAVGTVNPFRIHTDNWTESTIQPIIVHSNQETVLLQSDWGYFSLGSLDSGTDVPITEFNIDNRTGMNP